MLSIRRSRNLPHVKRGQLVRVPLELVRLLKEASDLALRLAGESEVDCRDFLFRFCSHKATTITF